MASMAFTVGLVAFLVYQLGGIGWSEVLVSVPLNPWFYLLFAAFYLCFPLFESAVYYLLWDCPLRLSFPALLKKRVYSKYLLDYSGEAYLYLWARRNVDLPPRHLLHTIKDNIIISSTTSMLVGLTVLLWLLFGGRIPLPPAMLEHSVTHAGAAILAVGCVAALVFKFRHRILFLPRRTAVWLFGLHAGRLVTFMLLQLLMWRAAVPDVPLESWLSLLSIEVVITRIPFLPQRDFVFMGTGLEMAEAVQVAASLLAGMLLAINVLEKLLNLSIFAALSFRRSDPQAEMIAEQAVAMGE